MNDKQFRIEILHYVTVRNGATGELLYTWPFRLRRDAEAMKKEKELSKDFSGIPIVVEIETLSVDTEPYPPKFKNAPPQ